MENRDSQPVTVIQRICVLVAAIVAVGASVLQATGILGLTPAEFAASGAGTVEAASYAFAIWGVIYAWLLAYAVYQLVPGWADDATLHRFGWPSVVSMLAVGLWLVAAGADWRWATVGLIAIGAFALLVPLASPVDLTGRTGRASRIPRRDRWLVVTPLALLAGWLTIATGLNAIAVLTAEGFVTADTATLWALGGVAASVAVTLAVYLRGQVIAYPIPVIWGLIAVFVSERSHRPEAAWFALLCALVITAVAIGRTSRVPAVRTARTA